MTSQAHYLLSAETSFSAAHTLPGADMCDRFHGHNWRVRLTVLVPADRLDDSGMGVDFRIVERVARSTVLEFEHRYLNDLEPFREQPPSAERLAKVVYQRAVSELVTVAPAARVAEVEIWETPAYRVIYRPD